MVITDLLEKNARLYGSEISLVEINPSEERDQAVTWRDRKQPAGRSLSQGDDLVPV